MCASAVTRPARQFGAPQTIWRSSLPSKTVQTCRWSELGCGSQVLTSAAQMPVKSTPTSSMPSISMPANVMRSASSWTERSEMSMYSASQLTGSFISVFPSEGSVF